MLCHLFPGYHPKEVLTHLFPGYHPQEVVNARLFTRLRDELGLSYARPLTLTLTPRALNPQRPSPLSPLPPIPNPSPNQVSSTRRRSASGPARQPPAVTAAV